MAQTGSGTFNSRPYGTVAFNGSIVAASPTPTPTPTGPPTRNPGGSLRWFPGLTARPRPRPRLRAPG